MNVRIKWAALVASALLCSLAGCTPAPSSQTYSDTTEKQYSSAEQLALDSDGILFGTVGALRDTRLDDGGVAGGPKFSVSLYEFKIERSTPATIQKAAIVLASPDSKSDLDVVRPGGKFVLMVSKFVPGPKSSLASWGTVYVPHDAGAFTVTASGEAVSVVDKLPALRTKAGVQPGQGHLVTTVDDLLRLETKS